MTYFLVSTAGLMLSSRFQGRCVVDDSEQFDWSKSDAVVIRPVEAVAVYTNTVGNVVIRQQGADLSQPYGGEDTFIVIPRDRVSDVIKALQEEIEVSA